MRGWPAGGACILGSPYSRLLVGPRLAGRFVVGVLALLRCYRGLWRWWYRAFGRCQRGIGRVGTVAVGRGC